MSESMVVHPLADLFPMMHDDELAELAEDIRKNGLIHPIVVDDEGQLIDGRNRLRACEIAGVAPEFTRLNGHDAAAYIVSANIERRNLTKGQQAIALAMIYPDPAKGGRGNQNPLVSKGFSQARLSQARSVLRHSRALAEAILANRTSLDAALDKMAEEIRQAASTDDKLAELRAKAPDVAELVDEGRLSIEAGITELRKREQLAEEALDAGVRAIKRINDIVVQTAMIEKAAVISADVLAELDLDAVAAALARLTKLKGGNDDEHAASALPAGKGEI